MLISTKMNKLRRFGKRMQMSVVQYRVRRSSAKHETTARDIKIECGARDLSFEKTKKPSAEHDTIILGSAESAPLSISIAKRTKTFGTAAVRSSPSRHAVSFWQSLWKTSEWFCWAYEGKKRSSTKHETFIRFFGEIESLPISSQHKHGRVSTSLPLHQAVIFDRQLYTFETVF